MSVRVFVSYRHSDSADVAGRLHDHLVNAFGEDHVFLDVEAIEFGQDFRDVIRERIAGVDAVLVVIGPRFAPERLTETTDFVRMELIEAQAQQKLVVPVLVAGTPMPTEAQLPDELASLAYHHAAPLRPGRDFRRDAADLIASLDRVVPVVVSVVADSPTAEPAPGPTAVDLALAQEPRLRRLGTDFDIGVLSLAFSPDSSTLAVASDMRVEVWSPSDGDRRGELEVGHDMINAVEFSPDGTRLACGCDDATVVIMAPDSGAADLVVTDPTDRVNAVAYSSDGDRLAFAGDSGEVMFCGSDGVLPERFAVNGTAIRSLAISPDDQQIACAGDGGLCRVLEMPSGRVLHLLAGHRGRVWSVAFSPDGMQLASGGADGTVRLWPPGRRREVHVLRDVDGDVMSVAYSPDGSLLAGAGPRSLMLWDPANGAAVRELKTEVPLSGVAFSSDGAYVAAAGGCERNGYCSVYLWELR